MGQLFNQYNMKDYSQRRYVSNHHNSENAPVSASASAIATNGTASAAASASVSKTFQNLDSITGNQGYTRFEHIQNLIYDQLSTIYQKLNALKSVTNNTNVSFCMDKEMSRTSSNKNSSASASASAGSSAREQALASKGISQEAIEKVRGKDLQAVDANGNPEYIIAKGRDGENHLYEKYLGMGMILEYKAIDSAPLGSRMYTVQNPNANKEAASANIPIENQSKGNAHSPLILDTNKDGVISAISGNGVDINADGKPDGAATGGDKMLAMGDINGNGKIDGTEVFGNNTIDPFTGKQVNAANGFEALKQVAKSAQDNAHINTIDKNGNVDLRKLKLALELTGKGSLGLISDNNNEKLESLNDVSSINVNDYTEQKQTGNIQHNQIGTYNTLDGNTYRVDDVWFKAS